MFRKDEVVRIVAGPQGPVADYREKLPGRAAYVCPRRECIAKALSGSQLAKALRTRVTVPPAGEFERTLALMVRDKISSLLSMAVKAGMLLSGYSAVDDGLRKGRGELLLFAEDVSDGTREKIEAAIGVRSLPRETLFTKEQLGSLVGRETAGVAMIVEKGFADAVGSEVRRLKGLLNREA